MLKFKVFTDSNTYESHKTFICSIVNDWINKNGIEQDSDCIVIGDGSNYKTYSDIMCLTPEDNIEVLDIDLKHNDFFGKKDYQKIADAQEALWGGLLYVCNKMEIGLETSPKGIHIIYKVSEPSGKTVRHPCVSDGIEIMSGGRKEKDKHGKRHLMLRAPYYIDGFDEYRMNTFAENLDTVGMTTAETIIKNILPIFKNLNSETLNSESIFAFPPEKPNVSLKNAEKIVAKSKRDFEKGIIERHPAATAYLKKIIDGTQFVEGSRDTTFNNFCYTIGRCVSTPDLMLSDSEGRSLCEEKGAEAVLSGLEESRVRDKIKRSFKDGKNDGCLNFRLPIEFIRSEKKRLKKSNSDNDDEEEEVDKKEVSENLKREGLRIPEQYFTNKGKLIQCSFVYYKIAQKCLGEDYIFDENSNKKFIVKDGKFEEIEDDAQIYAKLYDEYLRTGIASGTTKNNAEIKEGIHLYSKENSKDIIRMRFEKNRVDWDGKPRIKDCFHHYLGVKDSPYMRLVTLAFFVKLYMAHSHTPFGPLTAFNPILFGRQGVGKSQFTKNLVSKEDYDIAYTELRNISDDTDRAHHDEEGRIIAELGELQGFSRTSAEALKSFTAATDWTRHVLYEETLRHSYRTAFLIGTSNEPSFLRAQDGGENRRFFPIMTGEIPDSEVGLKVNQSMGSRITQELRGILPQLIAEGEHYYNILTDFGKDQASLSSVYDALCQYLKRDVNKKHQSDDAMRDVLDMNLLKDEWYSDDDIAFLKVFFTSDRDSYKTWKLDAKATREIRDQMHILGWEKKQERTTGKYSNTKIPALARHRADSGINSTGRDRISVWVYSGEFRIYSSEEKTTEAVDEMELLSDRARAAYDELYPSPIENCNDKDYEPENKEKELEFEELGKEFLTDEEIENIDLIKEMREFYDGF